MVLLFPVFSAGSMIYLGWMMPCPTGCPSKDFFVSFSRCSHAYPSSGGSNPFFCYVSVKLPIDRGISVFASDNNCSIHHICHPHLLQLGCCLLNSYSGLQGNYNNMEKIWP